MKKALLSGIGCIFALSSWAQELTPLQLKTMQSRKFNKPPLEVMLAIKTYCEDLGALNVTGQRPKFDSDGNPESAPVFLTCMFPPNLSVSMFGGVKSNAKFSQIKAEALTYNKDSISIRARLMGGFPSPSQLAEPEEYSRFFKAVADTLFTEAIPLEPAEQR